MPASARSSVRSQRSEPSRVGALASRAERRKERTRERLLDAALTVFLRRGYDGATTAEIAHAADLGSGTFYCHFRDRRAAFEGLAQRTTHAVLAQWKAALSPGMPVARGVTLALEIAAAHWRAERPLARLLLEGGPSFGTASHLRLVGELAAILRLRFRRPNGARLPAGDARALAALVVGLAIEIGRLELDPGRKGSDAVRRLIRAAGRATSP